MPSFVADNLRFLHTPKTGGMWATHAMCAAGITPAYSELTFHASLAELSPRSDAFTIAFVRHPLAWWRSYWAYRMAHGWVDGSEIDDVAAADDFHEFVRSVIAHLPGFAGVVFERYVGAADRPISFIGYHERLASDLERGLRYAGLRFDASALGAEPPRNTSDFERHPATYTRALATELARAEQAVIERFYPWRAIPEELLAGRRAVSAARSPATRAAEDRALRARDAGALTYTVERLEAQVAELTAQLATSDEAYRRLASSRLVRRSRRVRVAFYALRDRWRAVRTPRARGMRPAARLELDAGTGGEAGGTPAG